MEIGIFVTLLPLLHAESSILGHGGIGYNQGHHGLSHGYNQVYNEVQKPSYNTGHNQLYNIAQPGYNAWYNGYNQPNYPSESFHQSNHFQTAFSSVPAVPDIQEESFLLPETIFTLQKNHEPIHDIDPLVAAYSQAPHVIDQEPVDESLLAAYAQAPREIYQEPVDESLVAAYAQAPRDIYQEPVDESLVAAYVQAPRDIYQEQVNEPLVAAYAQAPHDIYQEPVDEPLVAAYAQARGHPVDASSGDSTAASQFHAQDESGNHEYGYQNVNSAKHEVGSADGGVRGSYSWWDEAGHHTVHYVADQEGFRIIKWTDPEDGDLAKYNEGNNANVEHSQSCNSSNSHGEEFFSLEEAFIHLSVE